MKKLIPKYQTGNSVKKRSTAYVFAEKQKDSIIQPFEIEGNNLKQYYAKNDPSVDVKVMPFYGQQQYDSLQNTIGKFSDEDKVFLFGHAGKTLGGVEHTKIAEDLKAKNAKTCYAGSCNFEEYATPYKSMQDFYYRGKDQWLGVNPNSNNIISAMFSKSNDYNAGVVKAIKPVEGNQYNRVFNRPKADTITIKSTSPSLSIGMQKKGGELIAKNTCCNSNTESALIPKHQTGGYLKNIESSKVICSSCGWSWKKTESSKEDLYTCHKCGNNNKQKKLIGENHKQVTGILKHQLGAKFKELNDNSITQTLKIFDPTGLSSYPDVYYSGKDFVKDPSWSNAGTLALNTLGALPVLGKVTGPIRLNKLFSESSKLLNRAGDMAAKIEKAPLELLSKTFSGFKGIPDKQIKQGADWILKQNDNMSTLITDKLSNRLKTNKGFTYQAKDKSDKVNDIVNGLNILNLSSDILGASNSFKNIKPRLTIANK